MKVHHGQKKLMEIRKAGVRRFVVQFNRSHLFHFISELLFYHHGGSTVDFGKPTVSRSVMGHHGLVNFSIPG